MNEKWKIVMFICIKFVIVISLLFFLWCKTTETVNTLKIMLISNEGYVCYFPNIKTFFNQNYYGNYGSKPGKLFSMNFIGLWLLPQTFFVVGVEECWNCSKNQRHSPSSAAWKHCTTGVLPASCGIIWRENASLQKTDWSYWESSCIALARPNVNSTRWSPAANWSCSNCNVLGNDSYAC